MNETTHCRSIYKSKRLETTQTQEGTGCVTPVHLPERVLGSYGKNEEDLYRCGITSKTPG